MLRGFLSCSLLLSIWLSLSSQVVTLNPSSDAFIRGGAYSVNNYGMEPELVVKQGNVADFFRRSLLTFSLHSLDTEGIDSVILRLYLKEISGPMKVEVFQSSPNWDESGINWDNAPLAGRIINDVSLKESGSWVRVNITSGFLTELRVSDFLGLSLYDTTAFNEQAKFHSRESAENKPELKVYYGNGPSPVSPADLSAKATDTLTIELEWKDLSYNETGFILQRRSATSSYSVIDTLAFNQQFYRDKALEEDREYTYRISAMGYYGSSSWSNEASAKTPDLPDGSPNAPDGLTGQPVSTGQINLRWTDNSNDEIFFVIERKSDEQDFQIHDTVLADQNFYNDYGLHPARYYSYRVYASNAIYDSDPTQALTIQTGSSGINYYVDSGFGQDEYPGTHPDSAWRSLSRINSGIFSPGDTIFLARGSAWTGPLSPGGSGVEGYPIVMTSAGEGELPVVDGVGMEGQGVTYLYNQSFWEISELEITNDAPQEGLRRGVEIAAENAGLIRHIYLTDLYVHHIRGTVGNDYEVAKQTGGIFFMVKENREVPTRFDDIRIENCHIHHCDNQGIVTFNDILAYPGTEDWMPRRITNMTIRNNTIHHISKNAMILRMMDGGLVEYNLCYTTATGTTGNTIFTRSSRDVICQFNEGYDNQSPDFDGSLYDADLESPGCIFQYSYSHDNAHGLYWQCTVQQDSGIIVRYNISQNDIGRIFNFSYPSNGTEIYNNTVFIGPHRSPVIIGEKTNYGGKRNYRFRNNLIINMSQNASYAWVDESFIGKREFSHNLISGYRPSGEFYDPELITSDPMLTDPGSAATGLESVLGYRPEPGSPAINAGVSIENNGGRDYQGNPLTDGKPDIGAFEQGNTVFSVPGIPVKHSAGYDRKLQVWPNPSADQVEISFSLQKKETISVSIYDSLGRPVQSLADRDFEPGTYKLTWRGEGSNGQSLGNGLYICNLVSTEENQQQTISRAIIINRR